MAPRIKESYSLQEAMDNVAAIIGIDLDAPSKIGLVRGRQIVTDVDDFGGGAVVWLSEEVESLLIVLDGIYSSIHRHLLNLLESSEMNWDDPKAMKGIETMMALVGESAVKMDRYIAYRMGRKGVKVTERPDYQELVHFYQNRFAKQLRGEKVVEEAPPNALIDFEAVKRDQDYELFYIRKEDGKPYYDSKLIHTLEITCDFVAIGQSFEEDPLLKIRAMHDRDLQAKARQILSECREALADFHKWARKEIDNSLAANLSMAAMALFLAANPRNLMQNTDGKSCLQYFEDFHLFLRAAFKTPEYQRMIAYPPDKKDKIGKGLLHTTHLLSYAFFTRLGGVKQEAIGLIHRTMRRGEEKKKESFKKGDTFWNQFMLDDEKLRTLLAQFPSGPLFKILDFVREERAEDRVIPFDPIGQQNLPAKVYELDLAGKVVSVLRIACPTSQTVISKLEIIDEFRGFLRSLLAQNPKGKHLIINLQDRTSWKEFARCRALEELQKNAEFNLCLEVVTLAKSTEFYHQNQEYLQINDAKEFSRTLIEQFKDPESCGFYFPAAFRGAELFRFIEKITSKIHKEFFENKPSLNRRQREDFIEILYQFLVLKLIDVLEPDSISFTCKDALDIGPAAHAAFYAFSRLFNDSLDSKEAADTLRWLIYTPALFVRERPIDSERINRIFSALEQFDAQIGPRSDEIIKTFSDLYSSNLLKLLNLNFGFLS